MYLDLFDELRLNKRLVKLTSFEVAAYWSELQSILKQVVKKKTADEHGFFVLDRDYVERETTLTVTKQLKCEAKLVEMGVVAKDPDNPNRITISVSNMIEIITDEDTTKLKKATKAAKDEAMAAKAEGIKQNMKKALEETDIDLRKAYELWIDSMIDAANCRFTRAVVQLFEKTVTDYTPDKDKRLKIIEIATINAYKDASWAISRLSNTRQRPVATSFVPTKVCTGTAENVTF